MIHDFTKKNVEWTPEGRLDYPIHYPKTPPLIESKKNISTMFVDTWYFLKKATDKKSTIGTDNICIVLVKGLFGDLMPGNFNATYKNFKALGLNVIKAKAKKASATIEENAFMLKVSIEKQVKDSATQLVFLTHSKGGLDTLWALLSYPELHQRTKAVAIVQCTRGSSPIMESVFNKKHHATHISKINFYKEQLMNRTIYFAGYKAGCLDITSEKLNKYISTIDKQKFNFPIISVATWSITPTSWLDSYHERLKQIKPGCAHDGQFYIEDQLWPSFEQIILGNIDHAQPAMGGNGFDDANFWHTILHLFFKDRGSLPD